MKIFLIGLPGCGKSTTGKEIADSLGRPFVDLDSEIAIGEKQPIANIFESKGESQFRLIEKNYLNIWCKQPQDFVMATGGGTPCFFDNMELINNSGRSVFLDTEVQEIAVRMMQTELAKRPLFAGQDQNTIAWKVENMRSQRIGYYKKANITLSGQFTTDQIIEEILILEGKA